MNQSLLTIALKTLLEPCRNGDILFYLHPRTIYLLEEGKLDTGEQFLMYRLQNVALPDNIIRCWIVEDEQFKEQPRKICLKYQEEAPNPKIPEYVYFSILKQEKMAYIPWMNIEYIANRVDVLGGNFVFQEIKNDWIERPELEYFWRT